MCLTDELAYDLCHATVDFAGGSITAQNFRGERVAFRNVCSHRCIQMREAGIGHGPLRCPYHGWMYDAAGVPARIPDNRLFYGLDRAARQELRLAPAQLEVCGDLIFVSAAAPPLAECLGDDFTRLAAISLRKSWIVGTHHNRNSAAADWRDGFSLAQQGEWLLIRRHVTLGDGSRDASAVLLNPARPSETAAPSEFREVLAGFF